MPFWSSKRYGLLAGIQWPLITLYIIMPHGLTPVFNVHIYDAIQSFTIKNQSQPPFTSIMIIFWNSAWEFDCVLSVYYIFATDTGPSTRWSRCLSLKWAAEEKTPHNHNTKQNKLQQKFFKTKLQSADQNINKVVRSHKKSVVKQMYTVKIRGTTKLNKLQKVCKNPTEYKYCMYTSSTVVHVVFLFYCLFIFSPTDLPLCRKLYVCVEQ